MDEVVDSPKKGISWPETTHFFEENDAFVLSP